MGIDVGIYSLCFYTPRINLFMKTILRIVLFFFIALLVFSVIGMLMYDDSKTATTQVDGLTDAEKQIAAAKEEEAKPNAMRDLVIKKTSWEKGGFGSVGLHSFSVYNRSKTNSYKDITFKFIYYAPSNTEIGSTEKVIYQSFPEGKTVRIRDFNTGFIDQQASAARVEVVE